MQTNDTHSPQTRRGLERHEKILEAAGEVFAEQGYSQASINEIVKRSGGSLGTVYKFFGNKLGLFEAYFQKATHDVFSQFHAQDFWSDCVKSSLMKFGHSLQQLMLQPDALAIYRLVLTERGNDQAEIQRIFLQNGPEKINQLLSDYLQGQVDLGNLNLQDCRIAAFQFVEMIKGPMHFHALFGHEIDPAHCDNILTQAVELFLNGARMR